MRSTPGKYMTETEEDNIQSVTQILSGLCCSDAAKPLFEESMQAQVHEVGLATLAEAVSRGARVQLKTYEDPQSAMYRLIQKTLKIEPDSIVLPPVEVAALSKTPAKINGIRRESLRYILLTLLYITYYDSVSGKKYSSKFFGKTWINCSPRTVVACLAFAKFIQRYNCGMPIEKYLEKNPNPEIFQCII